MEMKGSYTSAITTVWGHRLHPMWVSQGYIAATVCYSVAHTLCVGDLCYVAFEWADVRKILHI
jgi:hypothetical protein